MLKRAIAALSVALMATFNIGAIAIASAGTSADASTQESASKRDADKNKPPAPLEPRPLHMPKPLAYNLDNGLHVVLLADHRVPFVTVQLGLKAGDILAPREMSGLAAVTADMLNEGTTHRTSKQIATDIEYIGGGLKASADPDFSILSGSALSQYADRFLDIISDLIINPTFPEDELKLEKTNLLQELKIKHGQPDFLASERFHKVVFGNNPYSVVAPSQETVEHLTRQDLQKFHEKYYIPNGATLVVVGDFRIDKMKELIERKFAAWKSGSIPEVAISSPPQLSGRKIYLVDRPGSVQSNVKIGNIGIKKNEPDYFAAIVANQVLGGSPNSRLFLNIREQKGYTYGAYSAFVPRKYPGAFTASAAVRTPVTAPSLQEFLYELDRIRNLEVSPAELSAAKNYLVGSFQLGLETQGGIAQRLLEQCMFDLPANYLDTYANKLMAVTPEEVRAAARKHIDMNNLVITVVGDAKKIEPGLKYFAPVTVYDTEGKLLFVSSPIY